MMLVLSLVLFYIPRHVVCCDCNGIGWIATRLVDCMIEWSCWGSFLWSVCVHQLWVIRYVEGWNTPKYGLNGWLSLKAHHWATVQRFLTTIWFFWFLQCSDFGFLLSVQWLRRRLLVRGGSVLLDQGCQLAMAHSLSALHLHKQR